MVRKGEPYVITQDDWDDPNYGHYDKVFVHYDIDSDTLTELNGEAYDKGDRLAIGNENIDLLKEGSAGIIMVRNDRLEVDYEITR